MPNNEQHPDGLHDIRTAFLLNFSFALLEIIGGIWTNSLAILSDAIHDLGDSLSLALAWYLEGYSRRASDRRFTYGYRRFSLLGALINTIILLGGSLLILARAIPRLLDPQPTNAPGMVLFAIIGILVNGLAVLRLRRSYSLNARVVALHLVEDVLGWAAVLVVSIVLLFSDLYILDPILSILITAYILFNVARNLKKTLSLFLQAVPDNIDIDVIERRLRALDNVHSTHHTHIWSIDGEQHVLTTHIVVNDSLTLADVQCLKEQIKYLVRDFDFTHSTIEIEYGENDCMMTD